MRAVAFSRLRAARAAAGKHTPRSVPAAACLCRFGVKKMTARHLMQLIQVTAVTSGHPNIIFAAVSLISSGLTILSCEYWIELWSLP